MRLAYSASAMTIGFLLAGCDTAKPTAPAAPASWEYNSYTDEMRETESHYATLVSLNEFPEAPPYTGGPAILRVSQWATSVSADVQFICHGNLEERIAVKFDDKPVEQYFCSMPTDGSSNMIFIDILSEANPTGKYDPTDSFEYKLANAKQVTIELPTYRSGATQIKFRVTGFQKAKIWRKDEDGTLWGLEGQIKQ